MNRLKLFNAQFQLAQSFVEYVKENECCCGGGFDKDNLKIPTGGLGIPRVEMPQIAAADVPEFITFLKKNHGIQTWKYELRLSVLKVTQKDLNLDKVANMANELDAEQLKKPIIVSKDNFVLDGHHRFVALLNMNPSGFIPAYHVDLEINKLLTVAYEFPKTFKQQN